VRVGRVVVNGIMLVAIVVGIVVGARLFAVVAGG
jgi:hypothetical protein